PWSLDSTISEENKAVIEKMLLEENKSLPEKNWHESKENDKKCTKRLRSPPKSATSSLKWTTEEKEKRWTKIAMMIGSRNVLQVKSYARQYFKNKAKSDGVEKVKQQQQHISAPLPQSSEDVERKKVTWPPEHLRGRADPNLNAVKIEKLSDDEEVDITDEMDELLSCAHQQESGKSEILDVPKSPSEQSNWTEPVLCSAQHMSAVLLTQDITKPEQSADETAVSCSENKKHRTIKIENQKCDGTGTSESPDWFPSPELCEEQKDITDSGIHFLSSEHLGEENRMDAEELKSPDQEIAMDRGIILEEEKQAIPEFFVGRQAKTPERYLKIRNYILDQ
ncbi:hypothetical protein E2320_010323, partial [Naja naja]